MPRPGWLFGLVALVLLAAAGLLGRSLVRLLGVETGA